MNADAPVAIVGMGYVGLPLSLQFAESGVDVLGLDIDAAKVARLNRGESYILHVPASRVAAARSRGAFEASTDFSRIETCQAVVICVPTPLKGENEPDLSYVLGTGRAIAPHLKPGMLVVLESTTYPGTTDTELRGVLEEGSRLIAGSDFHLAYSPEREDPGNPQSRVAEIPKVVGGLTPACCHRAMALYGRAIKKLVPVENCRVAEAVKLTENIFRAVNIAMVNELKVVYEAMGIDVWDVIDAAKTKPFGYMPFYPGPGLGGHCIPIDPFYLTWKARQHGQQTRFIELAGEVNTAMPARVVEKTAAALEKRGVELRNARVLLLGIAYKPNVDDDRESPGYALWSRFEDRGAQVDYHDPHVPQIRPSREHSHFAGRASVALDPTTIAAYDAVVIVTQHHAVDYAAVATHAKFIVDTRNVLGALKLPSDRYLKA
jgi:UDP-N-acetyl-D-glucosamine dehydrogenase